MPPELKTVIADLDGLGVDGLRSIWRERLGEPPRIRSGDILRRALADQLQAQWASPDVELDRLLRRMAARHRAGKKPKVATANYKPGSTLMKDWNGQRYKVEVVPGGYLWEGRKHSSLSRIATLITGTRWNGPRFFGLRDGAVA